MKATGFSGTLAVANGGTGQTQAGQYGVMITRTAVAVPFTGSVSESIVATATIPAGLVSSTGVIKYSAALATGTLTGTYTLQVRLGGLGGTVISTIPSAGGSSFQRIFGDIAARGATNSQISWGWGKLGSANQNVADTASAIDMTVSQTLVVTVTLTNSADTVTFEGWNVIVYP